NYPSITTQLGEFAAMPVPEKGKAYNYLLASTKAFFTVAEEITFSADTLNNYQKKVYTDFVSLIDKEIYDRSIAFGETVGKKILERTTQDNYKQTRGMAKNLGSNEPGKWRPTPPDYLDGGEPWWQKIKPMVAGAQFKCPAPPVYSKDTNSTFYKTVSEVYTIGKNLTEEQKTIARYWDDNPFVIEHAGHLMYGNKKITPVGHWIGIAGIACKMKNLNPVETAQTYVLTSIAIFDSFISCWDDKYKSMLVRPVTVINEWFDHNWQPFLQTPPFPEHPSGHSAISAASATVLTSLFGDGFSFEDTSDLKYIGMKRKFQSFNQAAMEASISRVYGGIHYRTGVDAGAEQGRAIGNYVVSRLKLKE
ncbi:MAG: vanadium-dependent haloperoxidase, partial [Chitinophagaceae bacterium]